jgi:hypothetical protein
MSQGREGKWSVLFRAPVAAKGAFLPLRLYLYRGDAQMP